MLKRLFFAFSCLFFSALAEGQTFTFECVCAQLTGDTCDLCPTNTALSSRSFSGLLVYRNGTPYKWIDEPYTIRRFKNNSVQFIEQIPTPDQVTIALFQTPFSTMDGFVDSTFCQCNTGGTTYIEGPGIQINGDTISAVDTSFTNEIQHIDTFLISGGNLYVSLSDDNLPASFVTLPVPDGSETKVIAGTGISVSGFGTIASPYIVTNTGDLSATNELQTYSHSGTTTYTNTLSSGGGSWSITGAGIAVISQTGGAITVTANEVDGSTTNELQTLSNSSTSTTHTATLSNSGGSLQLAEGAGITIATTGTTLDGIATISAVDISASNELQTYSHSGTTTYTNTLSSGGGSWSITGAGIAVISQTGGAITVTANEVDGSITNEAQTLSVTGTTSGIISLNAISGVGGGTATIAAGTGIGVSQSGGTITISNTASTNAYVNGGNSFGAIATIGLNDNFRWDFEQNNTVRGGINTNGSWYIGSTSLSTAQLNINTLGTTNNGVLVSAGGLLSNPFFYTATGSGTGGTATILSGVVSMISGNVETIMNNTATAGTNGGAVYTAQVTSTASTNDAFFHWVSGTVEWSMGVDNDDVDNMKLHRFSRPSDNNGQGTIEIGYRTSDIGIAINKTGIGITTNGFYGIDVGGKARFDQYACNSSVLNGATVATLSLGTAAGTSPTIDNTVTDVWGNGARLKFTSGTSPTANGVICTITLDANYTFSECASGIWARSTNAAAFGYSSSFNSATRVITFTLNGTLSASTVYEFNIIFNGQN